VPVIPLAEARELVDGDALFLDVREQSEWDLGHIPGALHVPRCGLSVSVYQVADAFGFGSICLLAIDRQDVELFLGEPLHYGQRPTRRFLGEFNLVCPPPVFGCV